VAPLNVMASATTVAMARMPETQRHRLSGSTSILTSIMAHGGVTSVLKRCQTTRVDAGKPARV
jgi:hypothetical protein